MPSQSMQVGPGQPMQGRMVRSPQHRFFIQNKPWQLQPVAIAPVLPGDTMKSALFQARVVTDPLKSRLSGWWCEWYLFYVSLLDLDRDDRMAGVTAMFIDPAYKHPAVGAGGVNADYMQTANGPNFLGACLTFIKDCYFWDQKSAKPPAIGNLGFPVAVNHDGWWNSLTAWSEAGAGDVNVDINANATITASEVEQSMRMYYLLQQGALTTQTYDDYLKSYGISIPPQEAGIPELLRFGKSWTYPTNTVEPTTGVPTTACVWSLEERADKARFFKHPGFLVACMTCRPKVFLKNQNGYAAQWMNDMFNWVPAVLNNPQVSLERFTAELGPAKGLGFEYVYDHKDLFIYGDQFFNVVEAGAMPLVDLPRPDGAQVEQVYPSTADADGLFKNAGEVHWFADGVLNLHIASHIGPDTNPAGIGGYRPT